MRLLMEDDSSQASLHEGVHCKIVNNNTEKKGHKNNEFEKEE